MGFVFQVSIHVSGRPSCGQPAGASSQATTGYGVAQGAIEPSTVGLVSPRRHKTPQRAFSAWPNGKIFRARGERQFESAASGREYWPAASLRSAASQGMSYRGAASRARKRNTIAASPLPPVLRRRSDAAAKTFKGWILTDRGSRSTWSQIDGHPYRRGEGRGELRGSS